MAFQRQCSIITSNTELDSFCSVSKISVARVSSETYTARVGTENHVNVVSKNFLSFTVDPKYLFSSGEKYGSSQECVCMAASLAPAYLRIAGPSTAHMTFHNSTISLDPQPEDQPRTGARKTTQKDLDASFEKDAKKFLGRVLKRRSRHALEPSELEEHASVLENILRRQKKNVEKVQVTSDEWTRFSAWAKAAGFEIVFALNNEEKSRQGLWDPNTTLDILTVAGKEGVDNIYWQLGYECRNQSIDDYLSDLDTLRALVDSHPARARWRVVGADVTGCLDHEARSDFKDYVALSLELTDALMLNGNSSSHELERLSPIERSKLLHLVHASGAPLWVSERPLRELSERGELGELERAAAWMASLGHAARRGAQVHFRELTQHELYRPTLSFYMALLFKNLVGERVLNVDMESSHSVLFAHCTSLRHQAVPGAVTLFGANMDDEPARLSVKMSRREEGGDIMQFILSQNENGNIIVNGREMSQEGDIRPTVRRVRPYKTLLLNLPAKSFGFWVLANTKIEPCQYFDETADEKLVEAESVDKLPNKGKERRKRSTENQSLNDGVHFTEQQQNSDMYDVIKTGNKEFDQVMEKLNGYFREIHNLLKKKTSYRMKRQAYDGQGTKIQRLRRQLLRLRNDLKKSDHDNKPILSFIENLLQFARNGTRQISNDRLKNLKLHRNTKIGKRHSGKEIYNAKNSAKKTNPNKLEDSREVTNSNKRISRSKRSIVTDKYENNYLKEKQFKEDNNLKVDEEDFINTHDYEHTSKEEIGQSMLEQASENIQHFANDILFADNEIEVDNDYKKLWAVLHSIQSQLKKITEDRNNPKIEETEAKPKELDKLVVKTEITDEGATIHLKEQPNGGWVKSTFENIFYVMNDLNENVNRFWDALSFFN